MPVFLPFVLVAQLAAPRAPIDARRVLVSAPERLVEVALDDLKGDPRRLAWSPEGERLYVRAVKSDRWGNQRTWHYEITLADRRLRLVEREPAWASAYWEWKSARSAPESPDFRIAIESRQERRSATGVASAGAMAQSGGDPTLGAEMGPQGQAIAKHSMQDQMVTTTTLTLRRERLGEYVNVAPLLGLTFGWAPAPLDAIAYCDAKGRPVVMDRAGRKRPIQGLNDASLPAWSPGGTQIALAQRAGGNVAFVVVAVSEK